jgi:polyisoprenoid-binding protein YceI
MRTLVTVCLLAALALRTGEARAGAWRADLSNSSIVFSVRHLVINDVRGRFSRFTASFELEGDRPSMRSLRVAIEAAGLDTGHDGRDSHVRGSDFFDVEEHREIVFETSSVEPHGDELRATGLLHLHGVSRPVTIPLTLTEAIRDPWGNERRGVHATFTLDRRDWDMTWSETLDGGGLVVGAEVRVTASLELVSVR